MAISELPGTTFKARLHRIYGQDTDVSSLSRMIEGMIQSYEGTIPARVGGWSEADVFLIAYGDTLTGPTCPLESLHRFLRKQVGDLVTFLHLLPFYPYTSDDGFAVTDFRQVRADLGKWSHIQHLASDYRLVFDAVINHVSEASIYMKGYRAGDPAYDKFFVALDPHTDTSTVLRTRNLPLLHEYETSRGTEWLWTTFSQDQLDLNYRNPSVLLEILDVLLFYASQGAGMIRLDAIPYLWKQLGTSCAHLPQTHEIIKLIRDVYDTIAPHMLLLSETNVPHEENISYFGQQGDEAQIIYNFSLPPLIVWSLYKGDGTALTRWARSLKFIGENATYLNITATHDGIGMRPTEGILSESERAELIQLAYERGGDMTGKRNGDGTISPYELNISYFDAINDPKTNEPLELTVRRFLVSQAIPLALMGIPGIYLHSLLGSRNDYEGVARTGRARSINRCQLDIEDLDLELSDNSSLRATILSRYLNLLRIRRQQSAFHPDSPQEILDLGPSLFAIRREGPGGSLLALHNLTASPVVVMLAGQHRDLLAEKERLGDEITLSPYEVRWLVPAQS